MQTQIFLPFLSPEASRSLAERVEQEVLEKVPVHQYVVTIPKMLRIFFKHDRKLLGLISQCFYQTVKQSGMSP